MSMMGVSYPDGKALLDQPYRLLLAFGLLAEVQAEFKKERT